MISLTSPCFQVLLFSGWFCACVAVVDRIDIGLDQSLSMPKVSNYHGPFLDKFAVILCMFIFCIYHSCFRDPTCSIISRVCQRICQWGLPCTSSCRTATTTRLWTVRMRFVDQLVVQSTPCSARYTKRPEYPTSEKFEYSFLQ